MHCGRISLLFSAMFPKMTMAQPATGNSSSLETNYQLNERHENDGIEDNKRDSGMGTGSEAGLYSSVETWRQAIKHPPPGMEIVHAATLTMYLHASMWSCRVKALSMLNTHNMQL